MDNYERQSDSTLQIVHCPLLFTANIVIIVIVIIISINIIMLDPFWHVLCFSIFYATVNAIGFTTLAERVQTDIHGSFLSAPIALSCCV